MCRGLNLTTQNTGVADAFPRLHSHPKPTLSGGGAAMPIEPAASNARQGLRSTLPVQFYGKLCAMCDIQFDDPQIRVLGSFPGTKIPNFLFIFNDL